tara:strand:+ start:106 stop:495 length:390 start_codon:yes stop_codon:yes gene_type:complete
MQIITLSLGGHLNESLQVGDMIYYTPTVSTGNFTTGSSSNLIQLGVVVSFTSNAGGFDIDVLHDDTDGNNDGLPDIPLPSGGEFIMFGKNPVINNSSVKGYYANAKFVNNSNKKIEMFSVGSEISESSK